MPVDEKRKKLIQQLLGEPELFPDSFKSWLSGYLQRDPNIIWERSQIPILPYNKLNLGGGIVDSDIAATAAIARSKLNFGAGLVDADIASGAGIALSKLAAPAYSTYTPAWTSTGTAPALGNGTIVGRYNQIGKQVQVYIALTMGSTTTFGTGIWIFSLPVTIRASSFHNGTARADDVSTGGTYGLFVHQNTGTTVVVITPAAPAGFVGSTVPITWATGDLLMIDYLYEAA